MDIRSVQGRWWLPDYPDTKVAGALRFNSRDGGVIEAWGPRLGVPVEADRLWAANNAPLYFERIFGSTEIGEVTLLNCKVSQSTYSFGIIESKQSLTCSMMIKGLHVSDGNLFSRARSRIANLDEWAPLAAIKSNNAGGFFVTHSAGPVVKVSENVTVSIQPNVTNGADRRSARIDTHNHFYVTFKNPLKHDEILEEWIQPFVDLITLAIDRPSAVISFELGDSNSPDTWCEVGVQQGFDPEERTAPIWADQAILKFSELNPAKHLPRWYELAHNLQGIFNYTFGARYSSDILPENRYLNASTAAEAIHRELVESKRQKVDLEEAAAQAFIDSFPEDERKLLSDRMKHLNDESFHQRISDLYDYTKPFSEILAPNKEEWVKAVKKTRNGLTHTSGKPSEKLPSGDELSVLGESVFLVISVYMLVKLGFSAEAINGWLSRQRRTALTIQFLRTSFPEFETSA
jgi:hypothetical protein